MIEIAIALCLLAFVTARIRNIRRQWVFGHYAFSPCRPTKYFTTVYPGYVGGNARDRRKIRRKGTRVILNLQPRREG